VETTLITLIAIAFLGMLFINIFFRVKVFSAYKKLKQGRVEFDGADMLTQARIEELVERYPAQEEAIRAFTGGIRRTMSLASGLIVLITLLGAVLMWYR